MFFCFVDLFILELVFIDLFMMGFIIYVGLMMVSFILFLFERMRERKYYKVIDWKKMRERKYKYYILRRGKNVESGVYDFYYVISFDKCLCVIVEMICSC